VTFKLDDFSPHRVEAYASGNVSKLNSPARSSLGSVEQLDSARSCSPLPPQQDSSYQNSRKLSIDLEHDSSPLITNSSCTKRRIDPRMKASYVERALLDSQLVPSQIE